MNRLPGARSRVPGGVLAGFVAGALLTALLVSGGDRGGVDTGVASGGAGPAGPGAVLGGGGESGAPGAGDRSDTGALGAVGTSDGSGSASPGEARASGAAGPAGANGTQATTANVRGVTDTNVTIGVGLLDSSSGKVLNPYIADSNETLAMIDGVLARWKRENRLVVHGRTITIKVRWYQLLNAEQERAACTGFVREDKVFAVVAWAMQDGIECLASEFKTGVSDRLCKGFGSPHLNGEQTDVHGQGEPGSRRGSP